MDSTGEATDKIRVAKAIASIAEAHAGELETLDGGNHAAAGSIGRDPSGEIDLMNVRRASPALSIARVFVWPSSLLTFSSRVNWPTKALAF